MYLPYTHKSTQSIPTQQCFETGLSGFHLLTVTKFKMGFQKLKPKIIFYQDYKNFDYVKFRYDIVTATSNADTLDMYKNTIFNIFNCHVPIKKKYIRANEVPFMSKRTSQNHHEQIKIKKHIPETLSRY